MTDKEQEDERKQAVMAKALREEMAEIITRYCKAKLSPETMAEVLFTSSMKVYHAFGAAVIETCKVKGKLEKTLEEVVKKIKENKANET